MLCSNPSDHRRRSRAVRVSVPALIVVLAASGCVKQKPPGLKVADLESSIVFGLKPLAVAPPPGAPPTVLPPPPLDAPPPDVAIPDVPKPPPPKLPTLPPKVTYFCRTATINDFPTVATLGAPNPPKPGFYRYKKTPPELFGSDHYDVTPADLQPRLITNITKPQKTNNPVNSAQGPVGSGQEVTTTTYQYDQVTYLDNTGKNLLVDRIQVTDNPIQQSVSSGANIGPTEYVGGPDRGVALYGRQLVSNGASALFVPSSPLLLLPLPAVSGQTWQSVSVDPASGATYILYGRIVNRQRVDACGDVVEGWAVEAQTVFKDPRSSTAQNATFRYYVDTNNGGQIVYEKVSPINTPQNPANGTPLDAAVPASPEAPDNPAAAPASEFSLATRDPQPIP
jgi:hypothetical protein